MARIQINDLPTMQELTPEQLKQLFGAGQFKPSMEALENRIVLTGNIDYSPDTGVLTIDGDDFQDVAHVRTFKDAAGDVNLSVDLYSANDSGVKIDPYNPQAGKGVDYLHEEIDMSKVSEIVFKDFDETGDFHVNKSAIKVTDYREVIVNKAAGQIVEDKASAEDQSADGAENSYGIKSTGDNALKEDQEEVTGETVQEEEEVWEEGKIPEAGEDIPGTEGETLGEGGENHDSHGNTDGLPATTEELADLLGDEYDLAGDGAESDGEELSAGGGQSQSASDTDATGAQNESHFHGETEGAEAFEEYISQETESEADDAVADFAAVADGQLPNTDASGPQIDLNEFESGAPIPDLTGDAPQDPFGGAANVSESNSETGGATNNNAAAAQGNAANSNTPTIRRYDRGKGYNKVDIYSDGDSNYEIHRAEDGTILKVVQRTSDGKVSQFISGTGKLSDNVFQRGDKGEITEVIINGGDGSGTTFTKDGHTTGPVQVNLNGLEAEQARARRRAAESGGPTTNATGRSMRDPGPDGERASVGDRIRYRQQYNILPDDDPQSHNVDPVETETGNEGGGSGDQEILDLSNPGPEDTDAGYAGGGANTPPGGNVDPVEPDGNVQTDGPYEETPDVGTAPVSETAFGSFDSEREDNEPAFDQDSDEELVVNQELDLDMVDQINEEPSVATQSEDSTTNQDVVQEGLADDAPQANQLPGR